MVTLDQILAPERVRSNVPAASRKRTLEVLGEILASADPELSAQAIFDRLVARERLGSTGLGEGCALPHARVPGLDRTVAAFLRLRRGVDFDSPEHEPVDLVFGLLVPEESTDEHLEILAAIARVFSDERVRSSIRSADEPTRIREVLVNNGISA
jgi:PTS system nitrogen regulatory IIA component